ncbi:hypothetical protein I7I53_09108 [Histoplasma capsulatum var. duboisii H88]|uniref:Uncharacterized protein n=1 Tax=Ajellomyces capsulatus (strain H88) TaxID=544711 RepID=A0A8A1L8Y8_AJEC8|nr:hypothetical protein I7I53_09108 [Histoplasma capsulatum var. duboisii H88]
MSLLWHKIILISTSLSLLALTLAIPFTPQGAFDIVQRDGGSCPLEHYSPCDDPQAPANFCCPPGTVCITLNLAAYMVCCPVGHNCYNMTQASCDPNDYDPERSPHSTAKSRRPDMGIPKCGDRCCIPGARCKSDDVGNLYCQVSFPNLAYPPFPEGKGRIPPTLQLPSTASKSEQVSQTQTSSTSPSTSITTEPPNIIPISDLPSVGQQPTSTSSAIHNVNHSEPLSSSPEGSKFPPLAIVVGLIPGLVAGIILALIIIHFYRRRQEKRFIPSPMSKFSHFREKSCEKGVVSISDPIPSTAQDSVRTDFLRRQAAGLAKEEDGNTKSKFRRTSARVKSFFGPRPTADDIATMPMSTTALNDRETGANGVGGVGSGDGRGIGREPSTESIKVFSPVHLRPAQIGDPYPPAGNGRPQTTFSEMIERVGFQSKNGSPYFSVTATPPLPQLITPQRRV